MSRYAKRLDRDLVRWREAGWVNADGEAAIRRDVAGAVAASSTSPPPSASSAPCSSASAP